jgi:hypothetical protein
VCSIEVRVCSMGSACCALLEECVCAPDGSAVLIAQWRNAWCSLMEVRVCSDEY